MRRARQGSERRNCCGERAREIQSEYDQAAERIARFRAQTLDGVLAKLAFIARTLDVQSWTEKGADGGSHEAILYSDRGGPQGDRARCLTARACGEGRLSGRPSFWERLRSFCLARPYLPPSPGASLAPLETPYPDAAAGLFLWVHARLTTIVVWRGLTRSVGNYSTSGSLTSSVRIRTEFRLCEATQKAQGSNPDRMLGRTAHRRCGHAVKASRED